MPYGIFVQSQLNNKKLVYQGNIYNRSIADSTRVGVYRWQCDRRHTHRCYVSLLANLEGEIIREPASDHTHEPDFNRHQKFELKRKLVERANDQIDEPPVKIISELVTPKSSSILPSESNLKQAIRYQRRKQRPPEPQNSLEIKIKGKWEQTLDNCKFYLGDVLNEKDRALLFGTVSNLRLLSVSI